MIISSTFMKNSLENYNRSKNKENFSVSGDAIASGLSTSFYAFVLFIAVIFFVLELILLYFSISIALYCSSSREEKIVNFVLATVFTLPYVLIKTVFDPCSKNYLKNGMKLQ